MNEKRFTCNRCDTLVKEHDKFCPNCGLEFDSDGPIEPLEKTESETQDKVEQEDSYIGAGIVSFLFPIIGFIIYAINIGKKDTMAKSCLMWSIIGIIINIIVLSFMWGQ